ncbi:hypothetical protein Misp01_67100 [Microtetraspora sp. NBRC 13810]|uniref:M56 family metallopeptidase n=1 Tax=Microtetraspora sp. NBRC 13810 TaxID=3030990 RepID=UPI0024A4B92A|nr:M56 family metallopeptidase [Microtetraspora sp. NBRC 13810]GLW11582.1 hypothetical protein Misp01_67100 [Microtetraspora sp. NBRC 13810]
MTGWLVAAGAVLPPLLFGGRAVEWLSTAGWTRRSPRAALALWQAIGLAAGLGAVGVGLVAAVAPLAAVFPHGVHSLAGQFAAGRGLEGLGVVHVAALAWSLALTTWLVMHTARVTVRTVAQQRRQRLLVDLLAPYSAAHDAYVLPGAQPLAYCVPGRRARIVLSQGALDLLDPAELDAVLAHERAHARGHHALLLLPFLALHNAFPWLPVARGARRTVPVLLEMLADDRARRARGEWPLAQALVRMATAPHDGAAGALAMADTAVPQRVERLIGGGARSSRTLGVPAYAMAALLIAGPLGVLLAPLVCATGPGLGPACTLIWCA